MARVLVIEDNGPNLELMTYLLNAFGHATEAARDGDEGVATATRGGFDLVVCDIQLPGRDGFGVAEELRRRMAGAAMPLVAVTAFAQVGDREKVLAAGFDGYISKPIVPETFVDQLEAFLPPALRTSGRRAAPESAPSPDATPVSRAGTATILVVDNVEANLDLMRSLLEPFGYEIAPVAGVTDALRWLAGRAPDMIISDVHLRDGTGFDLLAAVKEMAGLAAVPFLFLSSTARGAAESARGLSLGARKFIVRPIDAPALLAEIQGCLGGD